MTKKVKINSKIRIKNIKEDYTEKYILVDPEKVDFDSDKISIVSTVGQALLDRREGEIIEVCIPGGKRKIKIEKIF